jgi:3-mercaptopyruvate sulfurtransferase SseA
VVVVGSGDHRSAQACVRLTRVYGLARVGHLEGGWQEWLREQQA